VQVCAPCVAMLSRTANKGTQAAVIILRFKCKADEAHSRPGIVCKLATRAMFRSTLFNRLMQNLDTFDKISLGLNVSSRYQECKG
jgi:hypothetical protein